MNTRLRTLQNGPPAWSGTVEYSTYSQSRSVPASGSVELDLNSSHALMALTSLRSAVSSEVRRGEEEVGRFGDCCSPDAH